MDKIGILPIVLFVLLGASVFLCVYMYRLAEKRRILITIYDKIIEVAAEQGTSFSQIGWGISYMQKHCTATYYDKLPEIVRLVSLRTGLGFPDAYLSIEFLNACDLSVRTIVTRGLSIAIQKYIYCSPEDREIRMENIAREYMYAQERPRYTDYISVVENSFNNLGNYNYVDSQKELFQQKVLQLRNTVLR